MKDLYDIIDELRAHWVFAQHSNINSGTGTGVTKEVPLYVDFAGFELQVVGVENIKGRIILKVKEE